jgi:SAM-dependent methyltransferase
VAVEEPVVLTDADADKVGSVDPEVEDVAVAVCEADTETSDETTKERPMDLYAEDETTEDTEDETAEDTEDDLRLTRENTVVVCSTPGLIEAWIGRGFLVLPFEYAGRPGGAGEAAAGAPPPRAARPVDLVKRLAAAGPAWATDPQLRTELSPAWYALFQDFPEVPRRIARLFLDPLLNDSGSLTESRDYSTYARAMDAIIDLKLAEIRPGITPGKIVDEGCADGALLTRLADAFPDSDFIGIDIAAEFIARAHERQRAGEFGGAFVHFHQRNLLQPIFQPGSIDTTICNSTLHELWSYGEGEATVRAYLAEKFRQTRPGGTLVVRDVTGFAERDRPVFMAARRDDGSPCAGGRVEDADRGSPGELSQLSTYAKFKRFAQDFQADLRAQGRGGAGPAVVYEEATVDGLPGFRLARWQDGVEFLTKMTYTDNWTSEMNEAFAFWSLDEWKQALNRAGFAVVEDAAEPRRGTHAYLSAWRVAHDFTGPDGIPRVAFYAEGAAGLAPLPLPPTNMVLVGRRPT